MMGVYLDESGKYGDADFVAVAGAVASMEAWLAFEQHWKEALREFGAPYLHMREFAHSIGPFAGWKDDGDRRERFLGRLMAIAKNTVDIIIGAAIDARVFQSMTLEQKAHLHDPYWPCLQDCLQMAAERALDLDPPENVEVYVEGNESSGHSPVFYRNCARLFANPNAVISGDPTGIAGRISRFTTIGKDAAVPLQLADWIAYEAHKEIREGRQRWPYKEFSNLRGGIRVYASLESLVVRFPPHLGGAHHVSRQNRST